MRNVYIVTVELAIHEEDRDQATATAMKILDRVVANDKRLVDFRLKGFANDPLPIVEVPEENEYQEFDAWLGRDYDI